VTRYFVYYLILRPSPLCLLSPLCMCGQCLSNSLHTPSKLSQYLYLQTLHSIPSSFVDKKFIYAQFIDTDNSFHIQSIDQKQVHINIILTTIRIQRHFIYIIFRYCHVNKFKYLAFTYFGLSSTLYVCILSCSLKMCDFRHEEFGVVYGVTERNNEKAIHNQHNYTRYQSRNGKRY